VLRACTGCPKKGDLVEMAITPLKCLRNGKSWGVLENCCRIGMEKCLEKKLSNMNLAITFSKGVKILCIEFVPF